MLGWPISMIDFSVSVAVGQACTQARRTHSEPRNDSCIPGETTESKPRPAIVKAKVPCTPRRRARSVSRQCTSKVVGEIRIRFVLAGIGMLGAIVA